MSRSEAEACSCACRRSEYQHAFQLRASSAFECALLDVFDAGSRALGLCVPVRGCLFILLRIRNIKHVSGAAHDVIRDYDKRSIE